MFSLTIPSASLQEIIFQSIWYGFISGMISGMVKIGWEAILPPRTSERNATNPPPTYAGAIWSAFFTYSCLCFVFA